MDIVKWQNIIIEWLNCLKLSKPIVLIENLRDGIFFKELLVHLSKKDKSICPDVTHISDFLKTHYPAYSLEHESAQIQDSVEITYAYSLLLHYCSLVDCSEEFIIPLCKDLNYKSQIFVKNFLEELQLSTVITRDTLINAIYKNHKHAMTPIKSFGTSFSSPKTPTNTPLLQYLQTPYRKATEEIQYKKEIKQLQAQLELERFEKADIQEELNIQYEKNKKLDQHISESQKEFKRLRTKILSLENFTPPSDSKEDTNLEKKRFQDEIVSLEKYVEILHTEQEQLQIERDKARDKLRKSEESNNEWQNKLISCEKQLSTVTEENQNYLQELVYLRERCDELSTMLHELNPKNDLDESYENDTCDSVYNKSGSIVDSATLAQTVVDVQLVDAQTENKILKTIVSDMEENITKLSTELKQTETEVTKLVDENKRIQDINDELSKKLNETHEKLENTKVVLQKTSSTLLEKNEENGDLNLTITKLDEKLLSVETSLNLTQKKHENLIEKLNVSNEINKRIVEKLSLEMKHLITEKENIHEKLTEAEQKVVDYKSDNYTLKSNLDKFNSDLENCLTKFRNEINYKDEFPDNSDTICKLSTLIDALQFKNTNDSKRIYNLQDSCDSLAREILKLKFEIKTLGSNEIETKHEIDHLKICLKTAENKIDHYEREVITNYENLIDKYKLIIEEKCSMISELTKLKDVLINKENTIMKLETDKEELIEELKSSYNELTLEQEKKQSLENNCTHMKSVLNDKDHIIKSLEIEKANLQDNIDVLNQQLLSELINLKELKILLTENQHKYESIEKENTSMQKKYDNIEEQVVKLETCKKELENKCESLSKDIIEKDFFIDELSHRNNDSSTIIETLQGEINVLQNDHKELTLNYKKDVNEKINLINDIQMELNNNHSQLTKIENELLESQTMKSKYETLYSQTKLSLNEKINYINDLSNEKHELVNNIDGLTNQLKSLEADLSKEKSLKEELNNDIKLVNEELFNEKSIKEEINNQFILSKQNYETETKNMCDKITEKCLEIETLQKEIGTLNQNIETINIEICNITNMLGIEFDNVQLKEKTIENLNDHLINLKNQLSLTLEEKQETMEEVKGCKQKLESYRDEFETYKNQLENIFENINLQLDQQIELKILNSCENNLDTNNELLILETLKEALHKEQDDHKELLGDMLPKIIKLKQNIYNLSFENHRITSEMKTLQEQYNILDTLKSDVEVKLITVSEESSTTITELNEKLDNLQLENEKYVSSLEIYRSNLNKAHETLAEAQISVEGLIKKHKMEIDNYKDSIAELKHKNAKLEDQVHQLKKSEKDCTEELFSYQNKLQSVLQEYDSSVKLNEDIKLKKETEVKALSNKLVKQTESFQQLQCSLLKTNQELEASLRDIHKYRALKEEFEKSFIALRTEHDSMVIDYEAKVKHLKSINCELKTQADDLIKEVTKTKEKLNVEKMKQSELDVRIKNFTVETEKLEEKILCVTNKLECVDNERQNLLNLQEKLKNNTDLMLNETKQNHELELKALQIEIYKFKLELEENQRHVSNLEQKKQEFEEDIATKISIIDKLRVDNTQLQNSIDVLREDKHVLSLKIEQMNDELIKLKSCSDSMYKEKLEEINDTKIKLSYTLNLIESIYDTFNSEFEKSCVKITDSENTLKQTNEIDPELEENLSSKVQNEIINLKTHIETLLERKHNLELTLNNISNKVYDLEEKNKQEKIYFEQKIQEITCNNNEQLNMLQTQNKKIIDHLHERLQKEDETSKIYLKEVDNLNSILCEKMNEIERITNEKNNLVKKCHNIVCTISVLKQNRNELIDAQNNIIKIVETHILRTLESVENIEKDFITRLEQYRNDHEKDKALIIQLENFLKVEKNNVSFLENRIIDLTTNKNKLISLTSNTFINIHDLYNKMFEDCLDNDITRELNKIKENKAQIKDELHSVHFEKEIVNKEIDLINNELIELKKLRGHMLNYELVKSDYATLKNKYNLMSVCETENNCYKLKISDLESKLKDLQLENIKYQKEIAELQIDLNNLKNEYTKKTSSLETTCANWKKIVTEKDSEYEFSLKNYSIENSELSDYNIKLQGIVKELEKKLQLSEDIIQQEKCKNEKLTHEYKLLIEKCDTANKTHKEELSKLLVSYQNSMDENSRLQLDCTFLEKTIEECNTQLSELTCIKESYVKLLEDNNKTHTELDTLRYKRNRDEEEFKKLLEENKAKSTTSTNSQIAVIQCEYEEKLKKMKEKMVNLYKEEMEKEKKKCVTKLSQSEEVIQALKSQLWLTGNKNVDLTKEIDKLQELLSNKNKRQTDIVPVDFRCPRESTSSSKYTSSDVDERRISTLPRDLKFFAPPQVNVIEESITVTRKRRSVAGGTSNNLDHGLKMEDEEGELFSNTYLSDLKSGRCIESGRPSVSSRISELQYRNSLCPPHLKSSYPAETQFQSPGQFKDEDLKMGTVDLDDSISSSLLPGEKPRMKKDWGQTKYKKPGPPTPSKNGGQLSVQRNSIHPSDILRENNENITQSSRTVSTPSRIKLLFSRSGSHRKDSENISTPPKRRGKSIFKR